MDPTCYWCRDGKDKDILLLKAINLSSDLDLCAAVELDTPFLTDTEKVIVIEQVIIPLTNNKQGLYISTVLRVMIHTCLLCIVCTS